MSIINDVRKQHPILKPNALDGELSQLPSPPTDLPKPWNWDRWKRKFSFGFFVTLFVFWYLGRLLDIQVINLFSGSCSVTLSLFMVLGLYLMNRFQMRGYSENYSRRTNKPLHKAMKRYRRPRLNENFLQIFPRYVIDGRDYYLVWYVPGAGTVLSASLKPDSEPLLFNSQGQWLDDEILFSKVSLMWSIVLSIAPRSFQRNKHKNLKLLRRFITTTLVTFKGILQSNEKNFIDQGLKQDFDFVFKGIPAVLALYRNSLDTNKKIIQWANVHGWDSIIEVRFEDFFLLKNGERQLEQVRDDFKQRHNHSAISDAATKLVLHLTQKGQANLGWHRRKELELGLRGMTEAFPNDPHHFRFESGQWIPPEEMLEAYRSRVKFASQVDQKQGK